MITYQREKASDVLEEIQPLIHEHWLEITHYPDILLDPDYERYAQAENSGALRIYTVRDGVLIGYGIFFVNTNAHYKASLQAVQDILFLLPEWRGSTVGFRLVKFCEEQLRGEGVQVVYHHVKNAHPMLGSLLAHQGYEPVETIYAKRLDHHGRDCFDHR